MIDDLAAELRRGRAISFLLPLFFLSGATALVYQTLWVRELQIELFGTSTFAISTVLAAFMGGLALGGFAMGRWADRLARPLRLYGALEIGIGLYALIFGALVSALQPTYLDLWRAWRPDPVSFGLVQFAMVSGCLVLPTAAMGATLPLLARFATERLGQAGRRVGTLYAVNTLGAVAGTALAGFWLLPSLGRTLTTGAAAGTNVLLGLGAVALSTWAGGTRPSPTDARPQRTDPTWRPVVGVAIGLAGVAALTYEVAWTRLLGLMLGGSTYAFSVMLLSFLVGIALGGGLGGALADRVFARHGVRGVVVAFALVELGIALVSYVTMYLYPQLPLYYVWLFDAFRAASRPDRVWEASLLLAGLVMTPPAVLMGLHVPLAIRALIGDRDKLGEPVGLVYGANTLGGVLGAFLAGFVLLPGLGLARTIDAAAVVELLAAGSLLLAVARHPAGLARRHLAVAVGMAAVMLGLFAARPPWDPLLMTAGMHTYVSHFEDHSREGILAYTYDHELVYYVEGLSSVVTVGRNPRTGNLWLANNGKIDASSEGDLSTQILLGMLPLQFVDDPDELLVIGLASGITAGALLRSSRARHLEVVELEPKMVPATRHFGPYNHDVLDDPRLDLVFNDGRHHVLLSTEAYWNLVVSEPSNPWITGVANLFTRDFLEVGRRKLASGGVWCQWVQLYDMAPDDLRTLLATVADVFPYVNVYAIDYADLIIVASATELPRTLDPATRLLAEPGLAEELARIDIAHPTDLLALYQFDQDAIANLSRGVPLNTDDNMIIEYSAPRNLHRSTVNDNAALLDEHAEVPVAWLSDPYDLAALATAYRARHDRRAHPALEAAIEAAPDAVIASAWRAIARAWAREDAAQ